MQILFFLIAYINERAYDNIRMVLIIIEKVKYTTLNMH